jgi:integral membrane sensor domain MASE1
VEDKHYSFASYYVLFLCIIFIVICFCISSSSLSFMLSFRILSFFWTLASQQSYNDDRIETGSFVFMEDLFTFRVTINALHLTSIIDSFVRN